MKPTIAEWAASRPLPSAGWREATVALLAATGAAVLVWGGQPGNGTALQLAAVLCAAAIGAATVVWIACERRFEQMPVVAILTLALVLRLIAAQASPLLEDDHYRYLWDGYRTATAFDPYRLPPAAYFGDQHLPVYWQDVLSGINNPDLPSIYAPVLQWLFAIAYFVAPGELAPLQALLVAVDMAVLLLLARMGIGARWLLVYAVHPLILKEAIASAHPDGLVALWLLWAVVAWRQRRAGWVGVLLALAVGTKVAAVVALPLLLLLPQPPCADVRRRRIAGVAAGFVLTLVTLYAPFVLAGGSDTVALTVFGRQWQFNPLLFRLVQMLVPGDAARPLAALLILGGVMLLARRWYRQSARDPSAVPPVDAALLLLLLLSPVVNPWYWLWALPLAVLRGGVTVAAIGACAGLSYLNGSVLADAGLIAYSAPYAVVGGAVWAQAAVLATTLVFDYSKTQGSRDQRLRCSSEPHSWS
jgi:alpha-1,6-mannosyltransferase